jgi:hypothetical protein
MMKTKLTTLSTLACLALISACVFNYDPRPGYAEGPSWAWKQIVPVPSGTGVDKIAVTTDFSVIHRALYDKFISSSFDSGDSWISRYVPGAWVAIASSDDGELVLAADSRLGIFLSTNGGNDFNRLPVGDDDPQAEWTSVHVSGDGKTMFAGKKSGIPYRSVNSGADWGPITSLPLDGSASWARFSCDYTSRYAIACDVKNGSVRVSLDRGTTWSEVLNLPHGTGDEIFCASAGPGDSTSMGDEGKKPFLVVAARTGGLYTTSDSSFKNWKPHDPAKGDTPWVDLHALIGAHKEELLIAGLTSTAIYLFDDEWKKISLPEGVIRPATVQVFGGEWMRLLLGDIAGLYLSQKFDFDDLEENKTNTLTWQKLNTGDYWVSAAMSGDGSSSVVGREAGQIVGSSDRGASWKSLAQEGTWNRVAFSRDGSCLLAARSDDQSLNLSKDGGASWKKLDAAGNRVWRSLACANGGQLLAGVGSDTGMDVYRVFVSRDGGATWESATEPEKWRVVASSADGSTIVALYDYGNASLSFDQGRTWKTVIPADEIKLWYGATLSADGSKIYLASYNDYLYSSANRGATWKKMTPITSGTATAREWMSLACSADGATVVAAALDAPLCISYDGGDSWSQMEAADGANAMWTSVAMSSDGGKILAAMYGGNLWLADLFDRLAAINLAASPDFGGSISPSGIQLLEKDMGSLGITATPTKDYVFVGWTQSGNCSVVDSSTTATKVTCSGNSNVTAVFSKTKTIDVGHMTIRPNRQKPPVTFIKIKEAELPALPDGFNPSGPDRPVVSLKIGNNLFLCSRGTWRLSQDGTLVFSTTNGESPKFTLTLDKNKGLWSFVATSRSFDPGDASNFPIVLTLDLKTAYSAISGSTVMVY